MTTRKSKIARLPFNIREELNHQIMDNVPTKDILSWLNSDPTVRHYMERLFQNRFITDQNLSEWRQGAYQEWLDYRSCIEDVRDLSEQAARAALTDISGEHLLLALTAMFAQCTARKRFDLLCRGAPYAWRQEPQNLAEWRQGAYQEWLEYRACIEDVRDLSEQAARAALTDISGEHLLLALTAMFAQMIENMEKTPEIPFNRKVIVVQHLIKMALSLRRSEQRDEALRLNRERLELLREKEGHKSPSSSPPSPNGARASAFSNNLRAIPAHPLHPKAAAIHRPPAPPDPNVYPGHPEWPSTSPACYQILPDPNDPPEPDAGPDGPYAPKPSSGESSTTAEQMS